MILVVREMVRRAVLTLGALPDPDILGSKSAWPDYVRSSRDAYNASPLKTRQFEPSTVDVSIFLRVLTWFTWYRQEGTRNEENAKLFTAWVYGTPTWMLQERCATNRRHPASVRTVYGRRRHVSDRIIAEYPEQIKKMLDEFPELQDIPNSQTQGGQFAQTQLTDLPTSPKEFRINNGKATDALSHDDILVIQKANQRVADRSRKRRQQ